MLIAVAAALGLSALLVHVTIKMCCKFGWYDTTGGRKIHTGNIPRLGGVGVVLSFAAVSVGYFVFTDSSFVKHAAPLIAAGVLILSFGVLDDFMNMRALFKLLVQCTAAVIMIASGYTFTKFAGFDLGLFGIPLTFFWIIGIINAYNLIDGVDALCGGISLMAVGALGFAYIPMNPAASALCFILCASIFGFLLFNKPKAKIFLGDGGSQFLGFAIAALPLIEHSGPWENEKLSFMIVLTAIPVFDTFAAVWRRTREKRSFLSPDRAHLHHKLMNIGFDTVGILGVLYSIQTLLCCLAVLALQVKYKKGTAVLFMAMAVMSVFFAFIHYANRAVMRRYKEENKKSNNEEDK